MKFKYNDVVKFHGHSCPGLAGGYKMTLAALDFLQTQRPKDEELVAIVENDACGVDAVQYISGYTFGKGNLIFKDFGKMVYTFYDRKSKKAVRVSRKTAKKEKLNKLSREDKIEEILESNFNELFKIKAVKIDEPVFARLFDTVVCDVCHETAVESKTVKLNDKTFCRSCFNKLK